MTDALAWALIHFLWQGTLLGVGALVLLRAVRSPQARYAIGVATLAAMVLAVGTTTAWLAAREVTPPVVTLSSSPVAPIEAPVAGDADSPGVSGTPSATAVSPGFVVPTTWVLSLWGLGVVLLSARLIGGWSVARRLTRVHVGPVSAAVSETMEELSGRLGLTRAVRVLSSTRVTSPMVVGWLAPVILLPAAALTGLPASQVAALLAHELAHVRRHDYLVNLFQSVVETLLFFHPAVWWVSRQVRDAREECCDDLVVQVCDRMTYVSALTTLAAARISAPAVAASGGALRARVERLLRPSTPSLPGAAWLAALPILLVIVAAFPVAGTPEAVDPIVVPAPTVDAPTTANRPPALAPDTTPRNIAPRSFDVPPPIPAVLALVDLAIPGLNAWPLAQAPPPPPPPPVAKEFEPSTRRVRAGDVVSLRFFNLMPEDSDMSRTYRVGADGTIQLKYGGSLRLQGLTITEAQGAVLGTLVPAFYQSGVVTLQVEVVGGDVALQPNDTGVVARAPQPPPPPAPKPGDIVVVSVPVAPQLSGEWVLQPDGSLRRRGQEPAPQPEQFFYVTGEVTKPGRITWKEGMTLSEAIALAGGMTPRGKYGHIERPVSEPGGKITIKVLKPETPILPGDRLIIARKWFGG